MISLQEVMDAYHRLLKLGMSVERALQVVCQAYPEYRKSLTKSVTT
jgi:hypothetical protein